MADTPALVIQSGVLRQIPATDTLLAGAGVSASGTDLTLTASGSILCATHLKAFNTTTDSSVAGTIWFDTGLSALKFYDGISARFSTGTLFRQTAAGTVTNTTTETTLTATGSGSLTLPANFFAAGRGIRIRASGIYSVQAVPVTLQIRIKKGTTVILDTGAQTPPTPALTDRLWTIDATLMGRSATTVSGQAFMTASIATLGTAQSWEMNMGTTPVTISSSSEALNVTAQWGAGVSASDSIAMTDLSVEVIN